MKLLREWEQLRRRYGQVVGRADVQRLEESVQRRLSRIRHIGTRMEELGIELRVLEDELAGIDRALEMVLSDAVTTVRDEHAEAWSPTPVLGYRIWDVGPSGFHGYRIPWRRSVLSARCPTTETSDEVPHTDGRCGEPPCGIYAAKAPAMLAEAAEAHPSRRVAVGLVELTGKVVEHELGYRGQRACVVALGIGQKARPFLTSDECQIDTMFSNTSNLNVLIDTGGGGESGDTVSQLVEINQFLEQQAERRSPWTLGNPSESSR